MDKYIADPVQVHLLQDQYDALWALAEHRGKNIVNLIREGVATLLSGAPEDIPALVAHYEQELQLWPEDRPIEEHPAWIMLQETLRQIGAAQNSTLSSSNVAVEHDNYLAEIFAEEQQRWLATAAPMLQSK